MCKYCECTEDYSYDYWSDEVTAKAGALIAGGLGEVRGDLFFEQSIDEEQPSLIFSSSNYDVAISINYCPMCGRKLN